MNLATLPAGQVIPLASACGLLLAGVLFSVLTLWRAQSLLRAARSETRDPQAAMQPAIGVLQERLEALQNQVEESRRYPPTIATVPGPPRSALNLEKRSQALRMHRRGETPPQIAAALEVPRQEIELLLKVHQVVLRSI